MTAEKIIADERYHTCGRCKWEDFPFICHQCKWGEDVRKDLWKLKEDIEERGKGMTIEELRKQREEIDKQIREMKYEKKFGRVRLTKDTYKKCHRGWDLAIKFSDVHNNGEGDKWRNVISTSDKADILPYIIQLQTDLSMMRKELESERE